MEEVFKKSHPYPRACVAQIAQHRHAHANAKMVVSVPDTEELPQTQTQTQTQVSREEHWQWNAATHWKHWHGRWSMWQPCKSPHASKAYKSVRSLWAVDEPRRLHLYHRNQWYQISGHGPDIEWESGPWAMFRDKHSLGNGIHHPNSEHHRILQFPTGDLAWLQLALKPHDRKCVIFNEFHFMPSADARVAVVVGYNDERIMMVAMMFEEQRDSDERPEGSWTGTIWEHHRAGAPLEDHRDEPTGDFVGTETTMDVNLVMSSRQARWKGFKGGLDEHAAAASYLLVHLPYGFTLFAPKDAASAIDTEHAYYISWVTDDCTVRLLSAKYSAAGSLEYVKRGVYQKSA